MPGWTARETKEKEAMAGSMVRVSPAQGWEACRGAEAAGAEMAAAEAGAEEEETQHRPQQSRAATSPSPARSCHSALRLRTQLPAQHRQRFPAVKRRRMQHETQSPMCHRLPHPQSQTECRTPPAWRIRQVILEGRQQQLFSFWGVRCAPQQTRPPPEVARALVQARGADAEQVEETI